MQRRRKDQIIRKRKQIGVKIDAGLWINMKKLALDQGRTSGELLEDALRLYLEKHGQ